MSTQEARLQLAGDPDVDPRADPLIQNDFLAGGVGAGRLKRCHDAADVIARRNGSGDVHAEWDDRKTRGGCRSPAERSPRHHPAKPLIHAPTPVALVVAGSSPKPAFAVSIASVA